MWSGRQVGGGTAFVAQPYPKLTTLESFSMSFVNHPGHEAYSNS